MRAALRTVLFVAGVAAVGVLPLVGRAIRTGGEIRCALDGVTVAPNVEVLVAGRSGRDRPFCCVDCAQLWISRAGGGVTKILVTDETTGSKLGADDAWFARSRVMSNATTGCRIHVFATEVDARRHVDAYGGAVLVGGERPLRVRE